MGSGPHPALLPSMAEVVIRMLPPDAFTGIPSLPPEDGRTDVSRVRCGIGGDCSFYEASQELYYIVVDAKFVGTAELPRDQV